MSADVVREGRSGRFWMDDAILDDYASELGVHGFAVLAVLCRRAGKNGKSRPSVRRIAEDLGISERQAKRELKKLRDLKLISIETRKDEKGRQLSSGYTVLDPPKREAKPSDNQSPPEDSETPGGEGSVSHPKEDTEKKESPTGEGKPSGLEVKSVQDAMIRDLHERLRDRGLLEIRPLTTAYKGRLAGEIRAYLKTHSVSDVWVALDHIVFRWRDIALNLTDAMTSTEGKQHSSGRAEPRTSTAGYRMFS